MTTPNESPSVTSSILHKQDQFWENIIGKYDQAIEELKLKETALQNYIYELKLLTHVISTFNLLKQLNQSADSGAINQLLQLQCICPKTIQKEAPIQVDQNSFDLNQNDLPTIRKIKELVNREHQLIDQINMLRAKDVALTQMKLNMDGLMLTNFPNMILSTSNTISLLPKEIKASIKNVKELSEELRLLQKENEKTRERMFDSIPRKRMRLRRQNQVIEDRTAQKKVLLKNMLSKTHVAIMEDIFNQNRCAVAEVENINANMQSEINILKLSIENIKKIKF